MTRSRPCGIPESTHGRNDSEKPRWDTEFWFKHLCIIFFLYCLREESVCSAWRTFSENCHFMLATHVISWVVNYCWYIMARSDHIINVVTGHLRSRYMKVNLKLPWLSLYMLVHTLPWVLTTYCYCPGIIKWCTFCHNADGCTNRHVCFKVGQTA